MIPRTSIEEANKHLNLLHSRVNELEKSVTEKHNALVAKDEQLKNKLSEMSSSKNAEIERLRRKLQASEQTVTVLQQQLKQKDEVIATLQHNFRAVETLLNHKTSVQHLLQSMKEAQKNILDINGEVSSAVNLHENKDTVLNGFSEALSSQETKSVQKTDLQLQKSGEKRRQGRNKRLGGKEFYL